VPSFVPTPDHVLLRGLCRLRAGLRVAGALDGVPDGLLLRMNVPPRRGEITVPCQVAQRVGVHVRRPSGEAGMAEGVEREFRDLR
jgi:hypothetical protein